MYNIYQDGKRVAQTADKSYTLTGLKADTEYVLGVSKVEGDEESVVVEVTAKTDSEPVVVGPVKPRGLKVTEATHDTIVVSWDKVAGEQYNVYLGDALAEQGNDSGTYTFGGLTQDKEYTISIEATRNGMTSEAANITARTNKINPPFDVMAKEVGDRYLTIVWDSDEVIGDGMYNMYLDDVLQYADFKGREYTYDKLQPSTEYKICVSVVRDNQETAKSSIFVTTHAPIGEGEPPVPDVSELKNLASAYGDFEVFEDGLPKGWRSVEEDVKGIAQDSEWQTHGDNSLKLLHHEDAMISSVLMDVVEDNLEAGKYLAVVDFKAPENERKVIETVDGEVLEVWKYKAFLGFGDQLQYQQDRTETIIYAAVNHEKEGRAFITLGINDLSDERDLVVNFDALRIYKITPELYNYIKGGQMHRDRISEVFPYVGEEVELEPHAEALNDASAYHIGGGYYELPNGEKVRGKEAAQGVLDALE